MRRRLFLAFILVSTFAVMGCKITGKITNDKGVGVEGITIELSGDASMSTSTDADGTYVFRGLRRGTYKVKPADEGYTFEPPSKKVKISKEKKIAREDFKAATSSPPPSSPPPPWSNYQGDAAHTGYVPVRLNPDNFSEDPIWTKIIVESGPLNPVATGAGKVFVTTVGDIFNDVIPNLAVGLDSATGTELWRYNFDVFDSLVPIDYVNPPAYANGFVYVQSGGGNGSFLLALNAESAEVLDDIPYDNQSFRYYAPTIYDGDVYVGGGEFGGVYAYGFDGLVIDDLWFQDQDLSQSDQWTPAVNEEYVIAYTGLFSTDAGLTIIDRSHPNGQVEFFIPDENFEFEFGSENHLDMAPVLGSLNNVIVIQGGRLINFDLTNEDIGWEIPKGDEEGFISQPSFAEGIIFAVYEGGLHALNESDGTFIDDWEPWQPPGDDETINAPMIVTDNLIFVSTSSATYAVDLANQTEELVYSSGGQLALSEEGILFIATAEGVLIAIDLY